MLWQNFKKKKFVLPALCLFGLLFLVGLYAPFLASSKPFFVVYEKELFFPFFRYLFYPGFYTKPLDLFFNLLMFILPIAWIGCLFVKKRAPFLCSLCLSLLLLTYLFSKGVIKDPAYVTPQYEKLNALVHYKIIKEQATQRAHAIAQYEEKTGKKAPLLYEMEKEKERFEREGLTDQLNALKESYSAHLVRFYELNKSSRLLLESGSEELDQVKKAITHYEELQRKRGEREERLRFLEEESSKLTLLLPFVRPFHWEEDAGGSEKLNRYLPFWERTRLNRKDLLSSLFFGLRISLMVGMGAVLMTYVIGISMGLIAGYFGGKVDMLLSRMIEVWEGMPLFFTLLLFSTITQSKSLFFIIAILGLFGWTGCARFMRAEVLRERNYAYVLACKSLGFKPFRILFSHILPNAISPSLALLPFLMMSMMTSEAALAFLGLGEENSCSLGTLMSEARSLFPGESYLLWPPALILTLLLISIALMGDGFRDALDPKKKGHA